MHELTGCAAAFGNRAVLPALALVAGGREDGGIINFFPQPFAGSLGANPPPRPVVSVAAL